MLEYSFRFTLQRKFISENKVTIKARWIILNQKFLDHARMNKPGQGFYKVLAESALRALNYVSLLRVPSTGYERWKELQLNFDAREMLEGIKCYIEYLLYFTDYISN